MANFDNLKKIKKPRIFSGNGQFEVGKVTVRNWSDFQRMLALALSSLEKIKSNLKIVEENEDVMAHDLDSLIERYGGENKFNRELLRSIRTNHEKILEYLDGGGDTTRGLLPLFREMFTLVSSFNDKKDKTAIEEDKVIETLKRMIGNDGLEAWQVFRDLLNRERGLETQFLTEDAKTLDEFFYSLFATFAYVYELIVDKKSQDEHLLFQVLELAEKLDDLRGRFDSEFQNFVASGLNNSSLKTIVRSAKMNRPYGPAEDHLNEENVKKLFRALARVKENYYRIYRHPIRDRITRVRELMSANKWSFRGLSEDNLKEVLELHNELVSENIFRKTFFEDKFKEIGDRGKFEEDKKAYKQLTKQLVAKLLEKGYGDSSSEGYHPLVLFIDNKAPPNFNRNIPDDVVYKKLSDETKVATFERFEVNVLNKDDYDFKKKVNALKSVIGFLDDVLKHDSAYKTFIDKQKDNYIFETEFKKVVSKYRESFNGLREELARNGLFVVNEDRRDFMKQEIPGFKNRKFEDIEAAIKNRDKKLVKEATEQIERVMISEKLIESFEKPNRNSSSATSKDLSSEWSNIEAIIRQLEAAIQAGDYSRVNSLKKSFYDIMFAGRISPSQEWQSMSKRFTNIMKYSNLTIRDNNLNDGEKYNLKQLLEFFRIQSGIEIRDENSSDWLNAISTLKAYLNIV